MQLEEKIGRVLTEQGLTLSTAESCTGGGIAALLTSVPGSSAYFKGGIVAYSNEIKESLLHVSQKTIEKFGVVSEETVCEMAKGAMKTLKTDCSIATSGVAGPGGGTMETPVGTIWIAVAYKNEIVTNKLDGDEGRNRNVQKAIQKALFILSNLLENGKNTILQ
ncbi:MAG: CinA family protein [Bacteroides sp.]|nr:CinA family protein [Bacteroides sp.]